MSQRRAVWARLSSLGALSLRLLGHFGLLEFHWQARTLSPFLGVSGSGGFGPGSGPVQSPLTALRHSLPMIQQPEQP